MSLVKSAIAVGSNTLFSRVTGFVRDIMIARLLGAGALADIWVAAFRFPNLFRRIIAEGAFSAAFIPVYGRIHSKDGLDTANYFTGNILSLMGLWVLIGIILCQLLMPYLIYLFTPGYSENFTNWIFSSVSALMDGTAFPPLPVLGQDDKISLTISLTILCLPYAGFMFLAALMSALLNYHNKFMAAAFAPVLLNLTLILSMITALFFSYDPLWALGYGVVMAGIFQVLWLFMALKKAGLSLSFGKIQKDDNTKSFLKLFWPGLISGGVTQINILIGSIIASFQAGAMAYLYYADRIYQLPLGVVGVTLGIVLLPNLVQKISKNENENAQNLILRATEFAALLTLPASFALWFIPEDIIRLLFEYGAFGKSDTENIAPALILYGFGLPAFILIKIYSPVFYASHDTQTPMRFAVYSIALNIILSIVLFPLVGFYAIVMGTILSAWQNALCLFWGASRKNMISFDRVFWIRLLKIFLCCGFMIASIFGIKYLIGSEQKWLLAVSMVFGIIIYFASAIILAIFPKTSFKSFIKKQPQ